MTEAHVKAAIWLVFAVSVGVATGSIAWGVAALSGSTLLSHIVN